MPVGEIKTMLMTWVPLDLQEVLNSGCIGFGLTPPKSPDHRYCNSACRHPEVPIDVNDEIDPSYNDLACKIVRDMGLRYCGVDLMVQQDIRKPIDPATNNYYVIEINAAPGIDHYAESGDKQKRIVAEMYRRILRTLAGIK